jgi:hypothetical protein
MLASGRVGWTATSFRSGSALAARAVSRIAAAQARTRIVVATSDSSLIRMMSEPGAFPSSLTTVAVTIWTSGPGQAPVEPLPPT